MPSYDLWKHPTSGRWYVTWTVAGRSRRATTGTKDRRQAERVRAAFVLEHDRPPEARPDQLAVATVLDNYWERHAKKLASAEAVEIRIRHLNNFFGLAAVDAVNARSLERYKARMLSEGSAIGTINLHRGVLRAALKQAVRFGDLAMAPHVPSDREPPPRPHVLTRKQVAAMLRVARANPDWRHIATFIRLAIYTGARRGAILQLTWDRVDLKAGTVDFRLPGVDHNRKRRALTALPARLVASLRRQHRKSTSTHVINYEGEPIASVKRAFRLVAEAAKVGHVTPHVLKHTAVTWALRVASPWIVSGMTATSMRTLQAVYGKHMVSDLKAAAEAVAHSSETRNLRAKSPVSTATKRKRNAKKKPVNKGSGDGGRDRV